MKNMKAKPIRIDFTIRDDNMAKLTKKSNASIDEMVSQMNRSLEKMQLGHLEYIDPLKNKQRRPRR